jgi:hypothetical protein
MDLVRGYARNSEQPASAEANPYWARAMEMLAVQKELNARVIGDADAQLDDVVTDYRTWARSRGRGRRSCVSHSRPTVHNWVSPDYSNSWQTGGIGKDGNPNVPHARIDYLPGDTVRVTFTVGGKSINLGAVITTSAK